jgi:hypothetical protein
MAATIAKKALTPVGLGFNSKDEYSVKRIYDNSTQKIKSLRASSAIKNACLYILDSSYKAKDSFPKMFTGVSPEDIGIITSDFGEITGAIFLMKKHPKKYKAVRFPSANEKLIDFILVTVEGGEERFSSKAGQGGKPSITSVMPIIDEKIKTGKITKKFIKPAKVLQILSSDEKDALYWGPLKAAKYLETPGYDALLKTLKKLKVKNFNPIQPLPPMAEQLDQAVAAAGSFKRVMVEFQDFFHSSKYTEINLDVTKRLIETPRPGKEKRWGILHYPITAELIRWLNDDKNNAKELLTIAARELAVTQIYMDVYTNEMKYTVKEFKEASFKFGSPSSAPRPTNNRIGFTMKK